MWGHSWAGQVDLISGPDFQVFLLLDLPLTALIYFKERKKPPKKQKRPRKFLPPISQVYSTGLILHNGGIDRFKLVFQNHIQIFKELQYKCKGFL